jgi:hypothetical protein
MFAPYTGLGCAGYSAAQPHMEVVLGELTGEDIRVKVSH